MIANVELKRQSDRILDLISSAEKMFDEDDEMRAHIAKYVCILCSGFMENVVSILYTDFVSKETSSNALRNYLSTSLGKINNPNSEKLRSIAKDFDPAWEVDLNTFMQLEDRGAAVNYIMKDRHKIAHGQDSDITLSRIREHLLKSLEIVEFIEQQCAA